VGDIPHKGDPKGVKSGLLAVAEQELPVVWPGVNGWWLASDGMNLEIQS
jgi:hypothetical protein